MKNMQLTIDKEHTGMRIDIAASELSGLTRSQIKKLIEDGLLTVNGAQVRQNNKTKPGDIIDIAIVKPSNELVPEDIQMDIFHIDRDIIVVNKPPYMVVYPSAGHDRGTLMNAIAFHSDHLASVGAPLRPGIVHRLDKDTSGVMVVALTDIAYYDLVEQFRERSIKRKYKAIIFGNPKNDRGTISGHIGRSESNRKKMSAHPKSGKAAVTNWEVIERFKSAALIEARLGTGRTHQIRVHMASIGHPVLGDKTYGSKTSIELNRNRIYFPRQMLHAEILGFTHPITKKYLEFSCPIPQDMQEKIAELRSMEQQTLAVGTVKESK